MYDRLSDGQLKWTKLDRTYDVMYNAQTGERIEMTDDHKDNRKRLTEHFNIDAKVSCIIEASLISGKAQVPEFVSFHI